jgi:hypothetical protein
MLDPLKLIPVLPLWADIRVARSRKHLDLYPISRSPGVRRRARRRTREEKARDEFTDSVECYLLRLAKLRKDEKRLVTFPAGESPADLTSLVSALPEVDALTAAIHARYREIMELKILLRMAKARRTLQRRLGSISKAAAR